MGCQTVVIPKSVKNFAPKVLGYVYLATDIVCT